MHILACVYTPIIHEPPYSYPVHCAVLGRSLTLLKWLVDEHCCPLRSIRVSGKTRDSSGSFTPILTSRGRSLLGIAMEQENIDTIRYLVVEKGMPLTSEKSLDPARLIRVLDKILRILPQTVISIPEDFEESRTTVGVVTSVNGVTPSSRSFALHQTQPSHQYSHVPPPSHQESWMTDTTIPDGPIDSPSQRNVDNSATSSSTARLLPAATSVTDPMAAAAPPTTTNTDEPDVYNQVAAVEASDDDDDDEGSVEDPVSEPNRLPLHISIDSFQCRCCQLTFCLSPIHASMSLPPSYIPHSASFVMPTASTVW